MQRKPTDIYEPICKKKIFKWLNNNKKSQCSTAYTISSHLWKMDNNMDIINTHSLYPYSIWKIICICSTVYKVFLGGLSWFNHRKPSGGFPRSNDSWPLSLLLGKEFHIQETYIPLCTFCVLGFFRDAILIIN